MRMSAPTPSPAQRKRMRKAAKNLEQINEKIGPYIKRTKFVDQVGPGTWKRLGDVTSDNVNSYKAST